MTKGAKLADRYRELDESQVRKLVDNRNLIDGFIRDFRGYEEYRKLEYDEWHDILLNSLVKAVKAHKSELGKLSTLYYTIARRDVMYELRKASRKRRDSEESYEDLVGKSTEPINYDSHLMIEVIDILGGKQSALWRAIELTLMGYNIREIGILEEVSHMTIVRRLDLAYSIIREEYRGDYIWQF